MLQTFPILELRSFLPYFLDGPDGLLSIKVLFCQEEIYTGNTSSKNIIGPCSSQICCLSEYILNLSQATIDLRCSMLFSIVLDPRTPSLQHISGWLKNVEPPTEIIFFEMFWPCSGFKENKIIQNPHPNEDSTSRILSLVPSF